MIVLDNPKPTVNEFRELMGNVDKLLNNSANRNSSYFLKRSGTDLEKDVRDAAIECSRHTKFEGSIQLVSGISFPDIIASKYFGIEVKSTLSNNWKTIGNSILETTRVDEIERVFLTFGKLGQPVEFLSRPYEECLSGVAVTHYPRYQIDMSLKEGESIFDKMGIEYDKFRCMSNQVASVAEYYKSHLKQGESLWWAGDKNESIPITARLWRTLKASEKDELEATIYVYFPETIMSKNQFKYDRATLWLATQKGIINANVRDSFSSGGREIMKTIDGRYVKMPAVFRKIAEHIDYIGEVLAFTPSSIFVNNWGGKIHTNRVKQWINLVICETNDLSMRRNAKGVLEKIFCDADLL